MKKFLFFSFLFFFQYTLALAAVPITPNPPPFTEARCLAMQGRCVDNCEDTDGPSPGDCITSAPGTPMAGSGICCVRKDAVASTGKKIGEVQCLAKGGTCSKNCGDTDDISNGACFGGDATDGTFCCIARGSVPVLNITNKASCEQKGGSCRPRQLIGSNCNSNEVQGGTCNDSLGNTICCVSSSLASPGATNTGNSGSNNNVPPPGLNYTLLEKLPGSDSTNLSFSAYLSAVYKLAIWIVGLCALFMFLVGAFMYMLSAANTSKAGTAKSIMTDALIGLVLALSSYLILYVINPDLVNLKLPSVSMGGSAGTGTAPGTPLAGAPPAGSGSGCGGLSVSGINNSQCNDASQPLSDVLACIKGKYPDAKITSISDGDGFDKCKNNWSKPSCDHAQTSCHYGGGVSQKSSDCNKSHAADFSVKNASGGMDLSIVEAIKKAGADCGGRVNDETRGPHPHIHISDQTNCCSL